MTPAPFSSDALRAAFDAFPPDTRDPLLTLRSLIYANAADLNVGPVEESLKWGQPSYVPAAPKTGTPIRLGCSKSGDIAVFVHCQSSVLKDLAPVLPAGVTLDGTRGVLFTDGIDTSVATTVIRAALTYHL